MAFESISSPALLIDQARVEANIEGMLRVAGGPARLRPHVKTHKMAAVVALLQARGVERFKCATLAELRMLLRCGVADALLARQPVGPDFALLRDMMRAFPATRVSVLVDDPALVDELAAVGVDVWIDLDVGMGRTGTSLSRALDDLVPALRGRLRLRGLHAYDGHIRAGDLDERRSEFERALGPVHSFLAARPDWELVGGGSPTFALHAARARTQCSPGTTVFWDAGYAGRYPEMPFVPAARVLGRVVSRPGPDRLCVDIGTKAVAADSAPPRLVIEGLEEAHHLLHSEEHLVLRTDRAAEFGLGQTVLGIPQHICPTVAAYDEAVVLREGRAVDVWPVTRGRQ